MKDVLANTTPDQLQISRITGSAIGAIMPNNPQISPLLVQGVAINGTLPHRQTDPNAIGRGGV